MGMNLSTLQEIVEDRGLWHAWSMGLQSWTQLSSWTTATTNISVVASLTLLLVSLFHTNLTQPRGTGCGSFTPQAMILPFLFPGCLPCRPFKSLLSTSAWLLQPKRISGSSSVTSPLEPVLASITELSNCLFKMYYDSSINRWLDKQSVLYMYKWDIYYSILDEWSTSWMGVKNTMLVKISQD